MPIRNDGVIRFHWRKIEELWNQRQDPRVREKIIYHYREIQALSPDPEIRAELAKSIDLLLGKKELASHSVTSGRYAHDVGTTLKDVILREKPNVPWDDVAGLKTAKQAIREAVILPLLRPDLFESVGLSPWRGILLAGPTGCGKTLLARAAATECDATFFNVSMADILSKYVGESEKSIKSLFMEARKEQPSIIYVDEVDSISTTRRGELQEWMRSVVNQFLIEVDGLLSRKGEQIVLLGSTNVPWDIDPAMRRRFERRIYVPLPDVEARRGIFKIHARSFKLAKDIDFDKFAELTKGYTGSDIELICREAGLQPIRELDENGLLSRGEIEIRAILNADFVDAIRRIKPSVAPEEIRRYDEWAIKYTTE